MKRTVAIFLLSLVPQVAYPQTEVCHWRSIGPSKIEAGEAYDGSRAVVSGRVTSIASVKTSPDTVYVGTAHGGVWKSVDAGANWIPLFDQQQSLSIGAILVDKDDPNLIYAGTGEANLAFRSHVVVGDEALTGEKGHGLFRSVDGGRTWLPSLPNVFGDAAFSTIIADDNHPAVLLAGTTTGLFRSTDQGKSWSQLIVHPPTSTSSNEVTSAAFLPNDHNVAYVSFWGDGIYQTSDVSAKTPQWQRLTNGLPLSNVSRISLAVSSADPSAIYAYAADASSYLRGLYYSPNRGATWQRIANAPDLFNGQGFYNDAITADPRVPGRIFVGGTGDRSAQQSSLYIGERNNGNWSFRPVGANIHIDIHAIDLGSNESKRDYVGSDGGIWASKDDGNTWEPWNDGLVTAQFTSIDLDQADADFVIGGTQDNGTLLTKQSGQWIHVDDGDGGRVAVDPFDSKMVYDEYFEYKIARSTKRGDPNTFVPIYPTREGIVSALLAPFSVDPDHRNTIALGTDRILLTENGGRSWDDITGRLVNGSSLQKNE